jgi:histone-lysine N-methyltransferase SETMAR
MDITSENLRFYVYAKTKRGKSPTNIHQQLEEAEIGPLPSLRTIQRWSESFKDSSRTSLTDVPHSGRPKSATTDDNVALVKRLIDEMPRQSTRSLADDTGLSKNTIHRILTEELGLRKMCSTWVPHNLSEANKQDRILCAQSFIEHFNSHSLDECLKLWVTEDETWILFSTTGTKEDNKSWLAPGTQRLQVVRSSLTNKKVMLIVAFTGDGKLSLEGKPPGETIRAEVYTLSCTQLVRSGVPCDHHQRASQRFGGSMTMPVPMLPIV